MVKQIEVANLVKYGKTTKEIAGMLNLSSHTRVQQNRFNFLISVSDWRLTGLHSP